MTLDIRAAEPRDMKALAELIRALADYEHLTHLVAADEACLARELFGEGAAAEALIGWLDGEAVAYAVYFTNFSSFLCRKGLYLEDLFVRPADRGRGYGKAMLLAVARIAQARGAGRFEWMALDWNQNAIDFYQRLGATEMTEWRLFRVTGAALAKLAQQ